jgi:hypothetical protein
MMSTWEDFEWAIRLILALEFVMNQGYPSFGEIETYISFVVYGKPKKDEYGIEIPHPRCAGLCREVVENYIKQACKDHKMEKDAIQDRQNTYFQVITTRLLEIVIDRIVAYFIPQKLEFNGHNFLDSDWQSPPELCWPPYLANWQKVQKPASQCPYCHICLDSGNHKEHYLSSTCVYKCLDHINQNFGHMNSIQCKLQQLQVVEKGLKDANKTLSRTEQQPSTRPSFKSVSDELFDVWF